MNVTNAESFTSGQKGSASIAKNLMSIGTPPREFKVNKERPILFSGPMVRAILEGRKTQTRRVIKPQPEWKDTPQNSLRAPGWSWKQKTPFVELSSFQEIKFTKVMANYCPYGKPGEKLWVRETTGHTKGNGIRTIYKADCTVDDSGERNGIWIRPPGEEERFAHGKPRWVPSIHMPRKLSRITLEITNVRVERMQDGGDRDFWGEDVWEKNPWVQVS